MFNCAISPFVLKGTLSVTRRSAAHSDHTCLKTLRNCLIVNIARMSSSVTLLENINPNVKKMEYAVRGPLVIRAVQIEKELKEGVKKPFTEVIKANIGDCHAMGQKPITFIRQVLSLCTDPSLINTSNYPEDVKSRAKDILGGCAGGSVGSYSDSTGVEIIKKHVAQYIEKRDGGIPSNYNDIFLSTGASEAVKNVLELLNCSINGLKPGVMVPIPQYPLYSASIVQYDMKQVSYYLDEDNKWALNMKELNRALEVGKKDSFPRILVVINPGNPTGSVLTRENIEEVIKFAHKKKLFIFADEVYQDNVYSPGMKFHSFKKVLTEMGQPYSKEVELASFMSASKGYMGECGLRGGYCELLNIDPQVQAMLFKCLSARLCSSVLGQATMDCVVNPPHPGEPSYKQFITEKTDVLDKLKYRAKLVANTFNSMEGFVCNEVAGAMYAFPRLTIPEKAVIKAESLGQQADFFYAMQLLEKKGICVVPGSGFGQIPGTFHFRTTILPQNDKLEAMLKKIREFHNEFLAEFA